MIVRELTDDEQARLRKWLQRREQYKQKAREANEALVDLASSIAPEEGHVADLDRGAVVKRGDQEEE